MSDEARELLKRLAPWAKAAGYVCAIAAAVTILRTPACWGVSALVVPDARAEAEKAVAPLKEDIERLKQADAKAAEKLDSVDRRTVRTEAMVEMLVRDRGMRVPPPVALADGGTP